MALDIPSLPNDKTIFRLLFSKDFFFYFCIPSSMPTPLIFVLFLSFLKAYTIKKVREFAGETTIIPRCRRQFFFSRLRSSIFPSTLIFFRHSFSAPSSAPSTFFALSLVLFFSLLFLSFFFFQQKNNQSSFAFYIFFVHFELTNDFSLFLSGFHLPQWLTLRTENSFLFLSKLIYFDVKVGREPFLLFLQLSLHLFISSQINSSISTFFELFSFRMIQQNENYFL